MIKCKECGFHIELKQALEESPYSWPLLQSIWHICPNCKEGNHIRFVEEEVQIIKIISAPGPEWKLINKQREPNLAFRIDPEYLHIWYKEKHYEVKAKD